MKKKLFSVALCSLLAVPVLSIAQQKTDSDVPDRAEVVKLLDLVHARSQMAQVLEGMAKQMKAGAEDGFKEKVPDATPEQLAKVDKVIDGILGTLPMDELIDAIIPIYQKHLTKSDLAAITEFYSSAAGKKILKEMPAILSESMQAGGEIGRKAFAAKARELDEKIDEMAKESVKR